MKDQLASRVAARFADTQLMVRDEGAFVMEYLPAHVKAVEPIAAKVHQAIRDYQAAGIPIQHKVLVRLHGRGAAHADALYWPKSNPPLMAIAPKAYKDPILVKTIIHEFGHYMHDKVVPGGMGNSEVRQRYFWALKQKATGEGPQIDVLRNRVKIIENQIRDLEEKRLVLRPMPRKGEVVDFDHWSSGIQLHFKGRILGKSGSNVRIEILNPEVIPFNQSGYYPKLLGKVTLTIPVKSFLFQGIDPTVGKQIEELTQERSSLIAEWKGTARTEQDDRYESQRHEWAPTQYSRKNSHEWFAELCTTYVLGHLKKPVEEWLLQVIKTGKTSDLVLQ